MEFILYDTEYTAWKGSLQRMWSGKGEEREIVQISAILIKDIRSLHGTEFFSVLTKPIINPNLSDYFINLTGIKQEILNDFGVSIAEGLNEFQKFTHNKICCCWGDDLIVINRNIEIHNLNTKLKIKNNIDLRKIFNKFGVEASKYNSGTIENFTEGKTIIKSGSEHNALSDCISMLSGLLKLRNNYGPDAFDNIFNEYINKF